MRTYLLFVGPQNSNSLFRLGMFLSAQSNVIFFLKRNALAAKLLKIFPEAQYSLEPDFFSDSIAEEVDPALGQLLEEKYDVVLSMMCSYDRGIGHGYLINAGGHPSPVRASWSQERKYRSVIAQFRYYEQVATSNAPAVCIAFSVNKIRSLVFEKHQIPSYGIGLLKISDYLFWYNRTEYVSDRLEKLILGPDIAVKALDYEKVQTVKLYESISASYRDACIESVVYASKSIYQLLSGSRKSASYSVFGWIPSRFRRVHDFKYLEEKGVTPLDLASDRKIVFFPLHLEPEISLSWISPEFTNSIEALSWVSKVLPCNYTIVVKENPLSLGIRDGAFYRLMQEMPNVVLSKINVAADLWLARSNIVIAITGTIGIEAVVHNTPVISFGRWQLINHLDTVWYCDSFRAVESAFRDIARTSIEKSFLDKLEQSALSLLSCLNIVKFRLTGFLDDKADLFTDDEICFAVEQLENELEFRGDID